MSLSGPKALKSLDDAIRDIREEEKDISGRLSKSSERLGKMRESEADLFRKLAKLRLTPENVAEVDRDISAAERAARNVLDQHKQVVSRTQDLIDTLDERLTNLVLDRQKALEEADKSQDVLNALSSKIAAEVANDPEYQAKRLETDEMRAIAEESVKKTQVAEEDREVKGKPYRDDKLFMYLWESGYGTRNYKENNLVRWLDSLVARSIDYHQARPNYAMLNEIPMRLKEHADRQIAAAEEADAELDALEARAIDTAGGKKIRLALENAQERLSKIDAEMLTLEDQRDQATRDLADLNENQNPAMGIAVQGLAGSLHGTKFSQLVAEARRTATKKDDAILKKIDDVRLRLVDEDNDAREQRDRLKVLATRRRELEDIEFEFKKKRFDDPRSNFREDDLVGDLLGEFLRGGISAANYWGQWQRSQSWRSDTSNWGGGIGLPKSGRRSNWTSNKSKSRSSKNWGSFGGSRSSSRPSSGGFSRPRSGSKGSRKSGGFKTGGGF